MNTNDAIEAEFQPLAVQPQRVTPPSLIQEDDPEKVLEVASRRAKALMNVVNQQHLYANISGRKHLTVEAWQTLAILSGVTPFTEWCRELPDGWEARVTVRNSSGLDIGAAEAECLRSEQKWKNRDSYALRSMAQTRATSKAIRSVLAFIAVLAGFEPTPSDEMPDAEDSGAPRGTRPAPARQEPAQQSARAPEPSKAQETRDDAAPVPAAFAAKLVGRVLEANLPPLWVEHLVSEVTGNPEAKDIADLQNMGQAREFIERFKERKDEFEQESAL